jgi:hypothetical protein
LLGDGKNFAWGGDNLVSYDFRLLLGVWVKFCLGMGFFRVLLGVVIFRTTLAWGWLVLKTILLGVLLGVVVLVAVKQGCP